MMQNGLVENATQTVVDNSSVIADVFRQFTPQAVQEGVNTLIEGTQNTLTTENAQSVLSSLLESGSDALSSVCEAASDNPITATITAVVGVGTLVGAYFLRNHLKNKAAAAKNEKKDEKKYEKPDAGNDPSQTAANTGASSSTSAPSPYEDASQPRRSASTSPTLKRRGSGGHNND